MARKFIFILDALRADKIDFIKRKLLSNDLTSATIIPPFSFEPDAAFLCGKYPEETDSGFRCWLKSENYEKVATKSYMKLFPSKSYIARRIFNKLLMKLSFHNLSKFKDKLGSIPLNLINHFELSSENNLYDPLSHNKYETIFNHLQNLGIKFKHIGVPNSSGRLDKILTLNLREEIKKNNVVSFFISDLDNLGHKFGADSERYNQRLTNIIDFIKFTIYVESNDSKFIVFGDHGMVNIKRKIDIWKILKRIPLSIGEDYLFFLDSTIARFWFKREKVKKLIMNNLENSEFGSWVTDEEKTNYKINYSHNKFGQEFWWASGGTLISPNFWQGNRLLKGMHGYRSDVKDNHTCLLTNYPFSFNKKTLDMVEVTSLLKIFLGLNADG